MKQIDNLNVTGIVVFSAEWCTPCGPTKETVERVCSEHGVSCYTVDADKNGQLAADLGIAGLPTTLAVKDGEVIDGYTGSVNDTIVEGLIEEVK
jgi:thioredoxin-like negative regulator of GroEL